ncbi:MAG TPA: hypothetical protein VKR26_02125 [Terriglobales bacterium]|nr:hypothetical protein [Terriglobales bacterium]
MSPKSHLRALRVALLVAGLGCCSLAQASGPAPLSLTQLTRKAGFIFAGRVMRVERPAPLPGRVPVVQVTLRVERALRGAHTGQKFTLMQWTGAWDSGPQYRPGQRLLLFLYPRSRTGLTSVVGGRLGQFDLDARGNIVLRDDQQNLLMSPDSPPTRSGARSPAKYRYQDFAGRLRRATEP